MGHPQTPSGQSNLSPSIPRAAWDLEAGTTAPSGQAEGPDGPVQQLLVQWRLNIDAARRSSIHRELGGTVLRSIHTLPMQQAGEGVLDVVRAPADAQARERLLRGYGQRPEVMFAEQDGRVGIQQVSNDPSLSTLWGMQSTGFGSGAVGAWGRDITGTTTTVVGIVDSGIDYTHPDLYLNIWLNQGELQGLSFFSALVDTDGDQLISFRDLNNATNRSNPAAGLTDWNGNGYIDAGDMLDSRSGWENGVDNDSNGYRDDLIGWDFANNDNDPYDDNSHGTHVAGTVGAMGGNGLGVAGVNWQVQMVPLKFLARSGSGSLSDAVLALDYFTTAKIQAGQRGETGQFVGTNNSWGGGGYSRALENAIDRATQQDLLFIAAAGNGGLDGIGDDNDLNPSYPSNYSSSNVIAVAAITSTGALARYSNFGSVSVDLGAPGSSVFSTVPGGGYGNKSGTSMASPHVAGAAALLKSAFPRATAAQIRQALFDSATPTASLANKTVTGGRLNIPAALDRLGALVVDPTLPMVSVAASGAAAAEAGQAPGSFTLTRSGGTLGQALTVSFSLGGTATAADYAPSLGSTITFASNQTSVVLTITPVDDTLVEGPETLVLNLAPGSAYAIGTGSATVTIADNDAAPPPPTNQILWGTTGNNTITGGNGDDRIAGVPSSGTSAAALGRNQIDSLTGGGGRDTFLLADSRGTFYNDGSRLSQGTEDYALIKDFNAADDKLQLRSDSQYLYRFSGGSTEIFLGNGDNRFSNADELIGKLEGVNLVPGTGAYILGTGNSWTTFI